MEDRLDPSTIAPEIIHDTMKPSWIVLDSLPLRNRVRAANIAITRTTSVNSINMARVENECPGLSGALQYPSPGSMSIPSLVSKAEQHGTQYTKLDTNPEAVIFMIPWYLR